jgi:protocatechuate 3,4-dioxygenase alpha subunit
MKLAQTPSQTAGPYFAYGLTAEQYGYEFTSVFSPIVAQPHVQGEHIQIAGQVLDGENKPVNDAMIEISHVDAQGKPVLSRADATASGFRGFGRCGTGTDAENRFHFSTIKPGAIAAGEAPFINVIVMMRGMLLHTFTRIYFEDEASANEKDAVLQSVPAERRKTLIAKREQLPGGVFYRFDIRMQGPQETVFFDI